MKQDTVKMREGHQSTIYFSLLPQIPRAEQVEAVDVLYKTQLGLLSNSFDENPLIKLRCI
jgi:hypothetical protein